MKLRETLQGLMEAPPRGADRVALDLGERSLDIYPRSTIAIGYGRCVCICVVWRIQTHHPGRTQRIKDALENSTIS